VSANGCAPSTSCARVQQDIADNLLPSNCLARIVSAGYLVCSAAATASTTTVTTTTMTTAAATPSTATTTTTMTATTAVTCPCSAADMPANGPCSNDAAGTLSYGFGNGKLDVRMHGRNWFLDPAKLVY
jgi:hypothetical protein